MLCTISVVNKENENCIINNARRGTCEQRVSLKENDFYLLVRFLPLSASFSLFKAIKIRGIVRISSDIIMV